ncbi:MAG: hypothetical protein RBS39_06080 [Phycisphaerales bacterium]|jgi:hypothetical protein|nr:hypothetical protein [Phycisphaerales bacterium]
MARQREEDQDRIGALLERLTPTGGTRVVAVVATILFGSALAAVGLSRGYTLLTRRAEHHAVRQRPLLSAERRVVFDWPALAGDSRNPDGSLRTWMPREFQVDLVDRATRELAASSDFRPDALARAGRALEDSGWFEGHPQLERDARGVVRVSGDWRVPAAVVRLSDESGREHDRLVSWGGAALPVAYTPGRSAQRVILGAKRSPGQAWPPSGVSEALSLLRVLAGESYRDQIAGVDLSDFPSTGKLALLTDRGTRVVWGGPPERPGVDEQPTSVKLDRLARVYRETGRIDAAQRALDLYGPIVLLDRTLDRRTMP